MHSVDAASLTPPIVAAVPQGTAEGRRRGQRAPVQQASGQASFRRAATWLGALALAVPATASLDLVQTGGQGRLRITAGHPTQGPFAPWRPCPYQPTPVERAAALAILAPPPCFAAHVAAADHLWLDPANFSLTCAGAAVELAACRLDRATMACVASRVGTLQATPPHVAGPDGWTFLAVSLAVLVAAHCAASAEGADTRTGPQAHLGFAEVLPPPPYPAAELAPAAEERVEHAPATPSEGPLPAPVVKPSPVGGSSV